MTGKRLRPWLLALGLLAYAAFFLWLAFSQGILSPGR